eukprot:scaffold12377_cov23-Tisochrysis_lutea.AAC.3
MSPPDEVKGCLYRNDVMYLHLALCSLYLLLLAVKLSFKVKHYNGNHCREEQEIQAVWEEQAQTVCRGYQFSGQHYWGPQGVGTESEQSLCAVESKWIRPREAGAALMLYKQTSRHCFVCSCLALEACKVCLLPIVHVWNAQGGLTPRLQLTQQFVFLIPMVISVVIFKFSILVVLCSELMTALTGLHGHITACTGHLTGAVGQFVLTRSPLGQNGLCRLDK